MPLKYRDLLYVGLPTDFFQCQLFCYELLVCPSVNHTFYKFSHVSLVFLVNLLLYHLLQIRNMLLEKIFLTRFFLNGHI
jgi:hypothetical protein